MNYDMFEKVNDVGQERIGSRWVVTQKEKADEQKAQIKEKSVAKGFKRRSHHNRTHQHYSGNH